MSRDIKIELYDILELISCAVDYGFYNDVLFSAFRDMLDGNLSDEEMGINK